jgi:hypothetical protein
VENSAFGLFRVNPPSGSKDRTLHENRKEGGTLKDNSKKIQGKSRVVRYSLPLSSRCRCGATFKFNVTLKHALRISGAPAAKRHCT